MANASSTTTKKINLSAPWIDERDEELVLEVLRSGWLSLGPTGPRFEALFADAVGAPYCAAVSSGTAGLHLCMRLAGVGPGDEVITSPYSFVASANCAIYEGATPIFADIDPRTFNLDPAAVEAAITPRTKAIVGVDIFGYPCELDPLLELCERHGLAFVEDACEALGARVQGPPARLARPSGGLGVLPEQADDDRRGRGGHDRLRRRSTSCSSRCGTRAGSRRRRGCSTAASVTTTASTISRPRSASASSRSSTGSSRRGARSRRRTRSCSPTSTSSCRCLTTPTTSARGSSTWSSCPQGVDRNGVMARLAAEGVASAPYLPSIHLQSYMRERYGFREGMLPVSEDCSARTMALPFHARLEREDQEYVAAALRSVLGVDGPAWTRSSFAGRCWRWRRS